MSYFYAYSGSAPSWRESQVPAAALRLASTSDAPEGSENRPIPDAPDCGHEVGGRFLTKRSHEMVIVQTTSTPGFRSPLTGDPGNGRMFFGYLVPVGCQ